MDIHQLEKAKRQWQAALDLVPQLVCLLDADGRLIHTNRAVERWELGSVASVRGQGLHALLHPGCTSPACYFKRLWREIASDLAQGRRSEHNVFDPILNRYLSVRTQPLQSCPVQNLEPGELHALVVVLDISDQQRADAVSRSQLREVINKAASESEARARSEQMQARLLAILEKTTDYVAMANAMGDMLYLNPAGRALLGLTAGDNISHLKLCQYSHSDAPDRINHAAITTAVKEGLWSGESSLRDCNDHEIHASQVIIAHYDANGEVDSLSTILRDISERVQAAQAQQESHAALQCLSCHLVSIQENERHRIALELHDGLGQSLSLIKHAIENVAGLVKVSNGEAATDALTQLVPLVQEALNEVRRVCTELRPSLLDDLGIVRTLSWFFREFESSCPNIQVEKCIDVVEHEVPTPLHIIIYRILQEASHNIIKHANASRMRVSLQRSGEELHLLIEDDGDGFEPDSVVLAEGQRRGLGLLSMRERATISGGIYRLESSLGQGTRMEINWPVA
ncbi:MAG: histidine kinase [Thiobacillaceae bacterium]